MEHYKLPSVEVTINGAFGDEYPEKPKHTSITFVLACLVLFCVVSGCNAEISDLQTELNNTPTIIPVTIAATPLIATSAPQPVRRFNLEGNKLIYGNTPSEVCQLFFIGYITSEKDVSSIIVNIEAISEIASPIGTIYPHKIQERLWSWSATAPDMTVSFNLWLTTEESDIISQTAHVTELTCSVNTVIVNFVEGLGKEQ